MVGRLKTEAETGSFKRMVKGRSIKLENATRCDNKRNNSEEIKYYYVENNGDQKMSWMYAKD